MSIDVVVARIGQILAQEQQLVTGASTAPSAAATGTTPATPAAATGSLSFGDMLTSAQAATATGAPGGATNPSVQAMTTMADSLLGKPYVFGGGHAGFGPSAGYDCSGFVSAVLHAAGYLTQPADTTTLPNQPGILPGPGQYVTIYDRAQPGETGHVIIDINGQFYESGGMAGPWGGGGGVEKISQPSAAYLATFATVLHPSGL
jgi:cell wall-associated NlpC family hydrolase